MKTYEITVVKEITGFNETQILTYVKHRLIRPYSSDELLFDEEDLTRLRLIRDLVRSCDTNIESLEVILDLVDRVHSLQSEIKKLKDL